MTKVLKQFLKNQVSFGVQFGIGNNGRTLIDIVLDV